jgi:hypothetical protein
MFIKNKYYNKYRDIVRQATKQNRRKGKGVYFESHHILPKSVYPQYRLNKHNLVLLTAKEHFVCHHLLTKCVEAQYKPSMTLALWRMVHAEQHTQRITARVYSAIKAEYSKQQREKMLTDNKGFSFKGHKHKKESMPGILKGSQKSNANRTKAAIERIKNLLTEHNFTFIKKEEDKHITVECKTCNTETTKTSQYFTVSKFNSKMCKTCNPRAPMSKEHRDKIGKAHKGKVVSEETKQKLRKYYESK